MERAERLGMEDVPICYSCVEKNAGGVSLSCVVTVVIGSFRSIDGLSPGGGFMMEEAINREAGAANVWLKKDQAAFQDAPRFFKERSRVAQVMENIKEDQVRD